MPELSGICRLLNCKYSLGEDSKKVQIDLHLFNDLLYYIFLIDSFESASNQAQYE